MMGRPKQHDRHLPIHMRFKHGAYYRVVRNRWEPLGKDYGQALKKWAELESAPEQVSTIGEAINAYMLDAIPKLATATQRDYTRICGELRRVFGDVGINALQPTDVAQYLHRRTHSVAGNREMAVLSSVFNYAMRLGFANSNPCRGVRRNRENRRERLPTPAEIAAIRLAASPSLRPIFDLSMLTGLRKGDVLSLTLQAVTERGLEVRTSKTGAPLCFTWNDALRGIVDAAKGKREIGPLFLTRRGKPWSQSGLDTVWKVLLKRLGITDLHWHDLRAWALTTAEREAGRSYAQAMAGHKDAATTDRYLRDRTMRDVAPLDTRHLGDTRQTAD